VYKLHKCVIPSLYKGFNNHYIRNNHKPIWDSATSVFCRSHSGDIGRPKSDSRSPYNARST